MTTSFSKKISVHNLLSGDLSNFESPMNQYYHSSNGTTNLKSNGVMRSCPVLSSCQMDAFCSPPVGSLSPEMAQIDFPEFGEFEESEDDGWHSEDDDIKSNQLTLSIGDHIDVDTAVTLPIYESVLMPRPSSPLTDAPNRSVIDFPPSLQRMRLGDDDAMRLLADLDIEATVRLNGNLKVSVDAESIQSLDVKAERALLSALRSSPRSLFERDDVMKLSFVSLHQNERVLVKITRTAQLREDAVRNMMKNDMVQSYWDEVGEHPLQRPFLPLRGWWQSEEDFNTICTLYPLALKLSDHIQSAVVSDLDFAVFEGHR